MLPNQPTDQRCPCGTGKPFAFCCEPFIERVRNAPTAEKLMRSRYTAFVLGAIDYLVDTTAPEKRNLIDRAIIAEQVQCTTWTGLTILDCVDGQTQDAEGVVEFEAAFETVDEQCVLHERSRFIQSAEGWYYVDGDVTIREQI